MRASTISFIDYIDPSRVSPGEGLLVISGGGSVTAEELMADLQQLYDIEETAVTVQEWTSGMPKFPPGDIARWPLSRNDRGVLACSFVGIT